MAAEFGANWRVTATLVIASTPCGEFLLGTPEISNFALRSNSPLMQSRRHLFESRCFCLEKEIGNLRWSCT
jgi:hypothetical protein